MSGNNQQTQTTTSGPFSQYAPQIAGAIGSLVNQPYNPYQGMQVAPLTGLQQGILGGLPSALMNPTIFGANDYLGNTIGGGSMNPWTEQVANRVRNQATDAYNAASSENVARFNSPGSWGSSAASQAQGATDQNFARGLGDALGSVYQQGFDADQNRRLQAASLANTLQNSFIGNLGQAFNLGDAERRYGQSLMDVDRQNFDEANNYGWNQLSRGANLAGQLKGGAGNTVTTQGPPPDRVSQGLGVYALGRSLGNK